MSRKNINPTPEYSRPSVPPGPPPVRKVTIDEARKVIAEHLETLKALHASEKTEPVTLTSEEITTVYWSHRGNIYLDYIPFAVAVIAALRAKEQKR
jgi:hypothetical protein